MRGTWTALAGAVAVGAGAAALRRRHALDLRDRVALVTGGSRGLGLLLARTLGAQGCRVVVCARDGAELDRAVRDLALRGVQAHGLRCDVRDPDQARTLVADAAGLFGRLDIVVNNAGVIHVAPLDALEEDDFVDAVNTMFWGSLHVAQAARPHLRDALHGVQIGHPAHPLMVQVPIGAWLSAVLLDLLPDTRRSAHVLVNVGLVAALPAAVAGVVDWSRQHERQQRVGIVHAAVNDVGILLFGASSLARWRGRHGWGKALAVAGMGVVGVGGMLGGHIAYYRSGGANSADHLIDRMPSGWQEVGPLEGFADGVPTRAAMGDVHLVVVRVGEDVHALVDTCGHMGGPLSNGRVEDGCIRCPWHDSAFRLTDGVVAHGPATAAQQTLRVRVLDGVVSVRHTA